jgi:hypothetical protein
MGMSRWASVGKNGYGHIMNHGLRIQHAGMIASFCILCFEISSHSIDTQYSVLLGPCTIQHLTNLVLDESSNE